MGKVKTVIMGDETAEQEAREKARAKSEAKKLEKKAKKADITPEAEEKTTQEVVGSSETSEEVATPKKPMVKKASKNDRFQFAAGKKYVEAKKLVEKGKLYSASEAVKLVQKTSISSFDGSVELHINTTDKGIRGIIALPHGTGKEVRVAIADDALIANLAAAGKVDFDILVTSPDMMPKLARIAKILGPKGLMPSPKTGTIGADPKKLAAELSQGQLQWKTEAQTPIVHLTIGKVSFDAKKLEENLAAIVKAVGKDRIRSVFMKATMGPSVKVAV